MLALRGSILLTTLWWPAVVVAEPRQTLWALQAVAVAVELFLAAQREELDRTQPPSVTAGRQMPVVAALRFLA
jgi:hypothetical protein